MNFHYPYKHYLVGWALSYLIFSYGFWMIIEAIEMYNRTYLAVIIFILCMIVVTYYYYKRFLFYKRLSIDVYHDKFLISYENKVYTYTKENIKSIVYARHRQRMKVHQVIHIFGEDGHYFYFTNEIIKFRKLNRLLEDLYAPKYYKADKMIKGIFEISEEFLFQYIEWNKRR